MWGPTVVDVAHCTLRPWPGHQIGTKFEWLSGADGSEA